LKDDETIVLEAVKYNGLDIESVFERFAKRGCFGDPYVPLKYGSALFYAS